MKFKVKLKKLKKKMSENFNKKLAKPDKNIFNFFLKISYSV